MGKKKGSKGKQPQGDGQSEASKKSTDVGEGSGTSVQQGRPQRQDSGSAHPSSQGVGEEEFSRLTLSQQGRDDRPQGKQQKRGQKGKSEPRVSQPERPAYPSQEPGGAWGQDPRVRGPPGLAQMPQQPVLIHPTQMPHQPILIHPTQMPHQPRPFHPTQMPQQIVPIHPTQTAQQPRPFHPTQMPQQPGPSLPAQMPQQPGPSLPAQMPQQPGPSQPAQMPQQPGPSQPSQVPQVSWAQRMSAPPKPAQAPSQPPQGAWGQRMPQQPWGPGQRAGSAPGPAQPQRQEKPDQRMSSAPSSSSQKQTKRREVGKQEIEGQPCGDSKKVLPEPSFQQFAPRITSSVKSGRNIKVDTNHFAITILEPNLKVYHYDVVLEPDKPKFLLRDAWNACVRENFPKALVVFDGQKNALSKYPLFEEGFSGKVSVVNPENGKVKEFNIKLTLVRTVEMSIFNNFREKVLQDTRKKIFPEGEISVLEVILKNIPSDRLLQSGRVYLPKAADHPPEKSLSSRLDLSNGFYQAVYLGYKLYLNFDVAHKTLYRPAPMLDLLLSFTYRKNDNLKSLLPDDFNENELNSFIRTMKVVYKVPNSSVPPRIYRVNKIVDNALRQTFVNDENKMLVVHDYFKSKGITLNYPNLPLLWVGPSQRTIYLPMEFCKIVEDQVYKGELSPMEQAKIVGFTSVDATARRNLTMNQLKINYDKSNLDYLRQFGLSVSGTMERVPARVLDAPRLQAASVIDVRQGVWQSRDFLEPKSLTRWCILNLDKRTNKNSIIDMQQWITRKGKEFRMQIGNPVRSSMDVDPNWNELGKVFATLKNMELVFVIIPEMKGVYSRVKTISETQEGILTQCIRSKTISQPQKMATTVENLLLKVNAKLGGKNHTLHSRSLPQCLNGAVMIVGADVTHSSPGSKMPSVAAVAVSSDSNAFQYGLTTRVQIGEMIQDLKEIIKIHLRKFCDKRGVFPEKIIIFRDGVSEGEMEKVFDFELSQVKKACIECKCKPKITLLVIQKRHHTRLYPTCEADRDNRNFNVPVGTCVDTDIVHPRDLDFYLVSHLSVRGTARPTRYRLLYDDNRLTDDELERLSFYLCHMFSRCKRSVSYPSPTYNAHLGAFRARAYLEGLRILPTDDVDKIQEKLRDNISKVSPMFFV